MRRGGVFTASRGNVARGKAWTSPWRSLLRLMSQLRVVSRKSKWHEPELLAPRQLAPPKFIDVTLRVAAGTVNKTRPVKQNGFRGKNAARASLALPASTRDLLRDTISTAANRSQTARHRQPARPAKDHRRGERPSARRGPAAAMECTLALVGDGYCLVAADRNAARSIICFKKARIKLLWTRTKWGATRARRLEVFSAFGRTRLQE